MQINSRFREIESLFSCHRMKAIAHAESVINKGFPIVLHCIKTGLVKNETIKNFV